MYKSLPSKRKDNGGNLYHVISFVVNRITQWRKWMRPETQKQQTAAERVLKISEIYAKATEFLLKWRSFKTGHLFYVSTVFDVLSRFWLCKGFPVDARGKFPGCLTKTWCHILNLLIAEGTVMWISSHFSRFVTQLPSALSTPEGRESDFCEKWGKKKKDKKKSCDRER